MLILSCKRDQSIIIGDDIEIKIVEVKGKMVKLGVTAPKSVSIHRKEVYEAIQQENEAAAKTEVKNLSGLVKVLQSKKSSTKS